MENKTEIRNPSLKRYTNENYQSAIIRAERNLIKKALDKANNNIFEAWLLNCPINATNKVRHYSIEAYYKAILRHGLEPNAFMSNEQAEELLKKLNINN